MSLSVERAWPVERYARLVSAASSGAPLPVTQAGDGERKKAAAWQHFTGREGSSLQLALLESNHFMISCGSHIYESFSLWGARSWLRGVTRGDSILFIYRINNENRRFRVKFLPSSSSSSSLETCHSCVAILSPLLSFRELPAVEPLAEGDTTSSSDADFTQTYSQLPSSQLDPPLQQASSHLPLQQASSHPPLQQASSHPPLQQTSSHPPLQQASSHLPLQQVSSKCAGDTMDMAQIAKAIQDGSFPQGLGGAYAATNFPTEQLGSFVRLCLTDANFPAFVEAVEHELNQVTGTK